MMIAILDGESEANYMYLMVTQRVALLMNRGKSWEKLEP